MNLLNRLLSLLAAGWEKWKARFQQEALGRANPAWWILVILWVGVMIGTPIVLWILGDGVFPLAASLGVLAQGAATVAAVSCGKPVRWMAGAFLLIAVGTWAVEAVGLATGFPFGHYQYTALLQPQLSGVPLLIPVAWWMMLVPAWAVAEVILLPHRHRLGRAYPPVLAAVAGAAMTAWDLYLDPQMVARSLWIWDEPGGYFGIPWINFFGWWLTAFLLTLLARPSGLPRLRLLVIYTLTWALQAIGQGIFWGQPGPALAGLVGMGIFTLAAWRQEMAKWKS